MEATLNTVARMSISKRVRRLTVGAAITALATGGLISVASPASAGVHTPPPGCRAEMTWYVGSVQCAYGGSYAFQALVRCSDGTYRTGRWLTGPSPWWSQASCYNGTPNITATDVWVNLGG